MSFACGRVAAPPRSLAIPMKQSVNPPARKRIRLKPEVRSQRILDAALIQFSRHGFAASRIEDIARGAGLSKAGVYAHFTGKEEIFEALLARTLPPPVSTLALVSVLEGDLAPESIRERVEQFIDVFYAPLTDPDFVAMLRLLIAESVRAPHLIEAWRQDIFLPYLQQEERAAAALENGRIPRNALTENFATLAYSPGAHAILKLMLGEGQGEVAAMKQMHRRMLLEWLQIDPAARPDAAGRGTNPPEGDDASG